MDLFSRAASIVLLAVSLAVQQTSLPTSLQRAQSLIREAKFDEARSLLLEVHRTQPRNATVCHQIGLIYTQMQQFSEAAQFYQKALAVDPRLTITRKNLAVVLWFSNRKQDAEREFLRVQKALPSDPVPYFYLGMLGCERRQFATARENFLKAGDLAFENPEAFPAVLETGLATRDEAILVRLLSFAEKSAQLDPEVWFQAGNLFGQYGSYNRATQVFLRIRDTYSDQAKLMRSLGLSQLQSKEFGEAVRSFEALVRKFPASREAYLLLAEACEGAGQPEKAYDAYAKAIEAEPKSEEAYVALSRFASDHHNNAFALKILSQGLEQIPGSARLRLQQGVVLALDDKMPQAEESFRQASRADAAWLLPWLALGITQLQTSRQDEALGSFQKAAALETEDYRPHYLLALTLARRGGQEQPETREAILKPLQLAVRFNSAHADSRVLLGQTYLSGNQVELAILELERAEKLEPGNAAALYQLGIAYRRKGRLTEAQKVLARFQSIKARQREDEDLARKELVQILKVVGQR